MRAIAVHKTSDMPELMDLPVPRPAPGEIVVRLEAASLNPIDAGIAAGYFEGRMPHVYPLILGVDGAGRVTEVGQGVRGFETGDLVHGQFLCAPLGRGTFAEYAVVPEFPDGGALLRVPDGVSAQVAAALPTAGMTALGALDTIDPRPGRSILIVGATGGVGVFAVQLAAMYGAEVVATARPETDAWIRGLGVNFAMQNKPDLLARITAEVALGRVTVPIQQTITLDQVPNALARSTSGARGKTTIRI
jgi:NADPH:quinone reductase-like Zn-dependent oxidoreductase